MVSFEDTVGVEDKCTTAGEDADESRSHKRSRGLDKDNHFLCGILVIDEDTDLVQLNHLLVSATPAMNAGICLHLLT